MRFLQFEKIVSAVCRLVRLAKTDNVSYSIIIGAFLMGNV